MIPTDVAAYTSTEITSTATAGGQSPTSGARVGDGNTTAKFAPIVGGVVGGVVAFALLGFLLYLWKRDKAAVSLLLLTLCEASRLLSRERRTRGEQSCR